MLLVTEIFHFKVHVLGVFVDLSTDRRTKESSDTMKLLCIQWQGEKTSHCRTTVWGPNYVHLISQTNMHLDIWSISIKILQK